MKSNFEKIYNESIKNPEEFWKKVADDIFWFKKPSKILNKSNPPFYKWYEDGVTNTCYNALDYHIDNGRGDRTALIYDSPITGNKKKFTYKELREKVTKFAGAIKPPIKAPTNPMSLVKPIKKNRKFETRIKIEKYNNDFFIIYTCLIPHQQQHDFCLSPR